MGSVATSRASRIFVAAALFLGGCQWLLVVERDPDDAAVPALPTDAAATGETSRDVSTPTETGTVDGGATLDGGLPVDASGSFCNGRAVSLGSYCADFDGVDSPHGDFTSDPSNNEATIAVEGGGLSAPNALVLHLDALPADEARASWTAPIPAQATAWSCEFSWRTDSRPALGDGGAVDNVDLVTFRLGTAVYGLIEDPDGRVRLFTNGSFVNVGDASANAWSSATLSLDFVGQTMRVRLNDVDHEPVQVSPDAGASGSVFVGAYATKSAPWAVRFDNVYCTM